MLLLDELTSHKLNFLGLTYGGHLIEGALLVIIIEYLQRVLSMTLGTLRFTLKIVLQHRYNNILEYLYSRNPPLPVGWLQID